MKQEGRLNARRCLPAATAGSASRPAKARRKDSQGKEPSLADSSVCDSHSTSQTSEGLPSPCLGASSPSLDNSRGLLRSKKTSVAEKASNDGGGASDCASSPCVSLVKVPFAAGVLAKLRCTYNSRRCGVRPPVLLHGPPGSGKSSLIRWLAEEMKRPPPVTLFLDGQTEAKSLVGSWVCGKKAGEFEWQEGILARCVAEGRWVVIEQLQTLPQDVHVLLRELVSTSRLSIPEQRSVLTAHEDFALFAVASYSASASTALSFSESGSPWPMASSPDCEEDVELLLSKSPPPLPSLLSSWVSVHVPAHPVADILKIACRCFPAVSPIARSLFAAFSAAVVETRAEGGGPSLVGGARLPQLKDFLKLCRRLELLTRHSRQGSGGGALGGEVRFSGFIPERVRLEIVKEAFGVFLGCLPVPAQRLRAASAFGAEFELAPPLIKEMLFEERPSLREEKSVLVVGSARLSKCVDSEAQTASDVSWGDSSASLVDAVFGEADAEETSLRAAESSLTSPQLRLLERIVRCLACDEPVLLVGDTGTGKTFLVSFIAERVGAQLSVVNLHQQSQAEDLFGRWVPRHPPHEVRGLWRELQQLLSQTLGLRTHASLDSSEGASLQPPRVVLDERDSELGAFRLAVEEGLQRGASLLRRGSFVAVLRLAVAMSLALSSLLRKKSSLLSARGSAAADRKETEERPSVGQLVARLKILKASTETLLKDPAVWEVSAPSPRSFGDFAQTSVLGALLPPLPQGAEHTDILRSTTSDSAALSRAGNNGNSRLYFAFEEGALVEAVRTGQWLLLDEVNLAPPEVLQRLLAILNDPDQPLLLLEGGLPRLLPRHPNFRLFACMNPPGPPPLFGSSGAEEGKQSLSSSLERGSVKGAQSSHPGARSGNHDPGKRELPSEVRKGFTEFYVEVTRDVEDIACIVNSVLSRLSADAPSRLVAEVYVHLLRLAESGHLTEEDGKAPCFSLRTLSRALSHAVQTATRLLRPLSLPAALRLGFQSLFGASLQASSARVVAGVVEKAFRDRLASGAVAPREEAASLAAEAPLERVVEFLPVLKGHLPFVSIEGLLIRRGPLAIDLPSLSKSFVLTPQVRVYVHRICKLLTGTRCALLLEGPTSCGKTSMLSFLAAASGHRFVRINNHEHTDLQEYVGSFAPDAEGKLVFREGPLALAARHGWWVLIDELNLAPSDVLEGDCVVGRRVFCAALNRLLDSNRELQLPGVGVIRAHEDFQLFGAQNPAGVGLYGGRKLLSRALVNRFVSLQVQELELKDLEIILARRCQLPASRIKLMLAVYTDLQYRRCRSSVFFGSHGFMTIRDLMRWGRRLGNALSYSSPATGKEDRQDSSASQPDPLSLEEVALEGWYLIGERLRTEEERAVVRASLEKHVLKKPLKVRFSNDPYVVAFKKIMDRRIAATEAEESATGASVLPSVLPFAFTECSTRLLALSLRALAAGENLLLVGETGSGKTAVCELLSWTLAPQRPSSVEEGVCESGLDENQRQLLRRLSPKGLRVYNAHLQMEAAELLGSMRPVSQGDLLFMQQKTAAAQDALLEAIEEPPDADALDAEWESRLNENNREAACQCALQTLTRFYECLLEEATDLLICLRSAREHNAKLEAFSRKGVRALQLEDSALCFRVLRRALRTARERALSELTQALKDAARMREAAANSASTDSPEKTAQRKRSKKAAAKKTARRLEDADLDDASSKRRRRTAEDDVSEVKISPGGGDEAKEKENSDVEIVECLTDSEHEAAAPTVPEMELLLETTMRLCTAKETALLELCRRWMTLSRCCTRVFEWADGPLLRAMKEGEIFLLDEINLAQDAVLERLNSLLEDGRQLLLTERAGGTSVSASSDRPGAIEEQGVFPEASLDCEATDSACAEAVVALPEFRFVATMNPGGDFGKRELSPALRNRLTEVYVPAFDFGAEDAALLLLQRLQKTLLRFLKARPRAAPPDVGESMVSLPSLLCSPNSLDVEAQTGAEASLPVLWLANQILAALQFCRKTLEMSVSVRDAFAWISFVERFTALQVEALGEEALGSCCALRWAVQGFLHGGWLLLLDGLDGKAALNKAQVETLMKRLLEAERQQPETQDLRLRQKELRQRLDEAVEGRALSRLGCRFLLEQLACRLYSGVGLDDAEEGGDLDEDEGPRWTDTRRAFAEDGFDWLKDDPSSDRNSRHVRVGPFSLDIFCCASRIETLASQEAALSTASVPAASRGVHSSPSAKRLLGRLLRCLLLLQQPAEAAEGSLRRRCLPSTRHAVLLEGPPGAGKTFAVAMLARLCGRRLVRINLSQDTELSDLLGMFVPSTSSAEATEESQDTEALATPALERPSFEWADGVLTRHLRAGDWILLDELNLASQQTLEGLNSLLDHRRCVYLPTAVDPVEGRTEGRDSERKAPVGCLQETSTASAVFAPPGFVLFATQNPHASQQALQESLSFPALRESTAAAEAVDPGLVKALEDLPRTYEDVLASSGPSSCASRCMEATTATASRLQSARAVGGRKGLPLSFLNRFCRVRVEPMLEADILAIASSRFAAATRLKQEDPSLQSDSAVAARQPQQETTKTQLAVPSAPAFSVESILSLCAVRFVRLLGEVSTRRCFSGREGWEWNLRDVCRLTRAAALQVPLIQEALYSWKKAVSLSCSFVSACAMHAFGSQSPSCFPSASAAFALLARLQNTEDARWALKLMRLCFPRLIEATARQLLQKRFSVKDEATAQPVLPTLYPAKKKRECLEMLLLPGTLPPGANPITAEDAAEAAATALARLKGTLVHRLDFPLLGRRSRQAAFGCHALAARGIVRAERGLRLGAKTEEGSGLFELSENARRIAAAGGSALLDGGLRKQPLLLDSQRQALTALAAALYADWPVLLTGQRGVGKASLVAWLAEAVGASLCEVSLSPGVDATDLLGCYRQRRPLQDLRLLARSVVATAKALLETLPPEGKAADAGGMEESLFISRLLADMRECETLLGGDEALPKAFSEEETLRLVASLRSLLEGLRSCLQPRADSHNILERDAPAAAGLLLQCRQDKLALLRLCKCLGISVRSTTKGLSHQAQENGKANFFAFRVAVGGAGAEFEWRDSALVESISTGKWLLLRDAQLCSPAVLDRLNSLMEEDGQLLLTEGGAPRVLRRHPNFRLILSADVKTVGSLSNALRNRCFELFISPPSAAETSRLPSVVASSQALAVPPFASGLLREFSLFACDVWAARLLRLSVAAVGASGGGEEAEESEAFLALSPEERRWDDALLRSCERRAPSAGESAAAVATLRLLGLFLTTCASPCGLEDGLEVDGRVSGSARERRCAFHASLGHPRLSPLLLQDALRLLLNQCGNAMSCQVAEAMAVVHALLQTLGKLLANSDAMRKFTNLVTGAATGGKASSASAVGDARGEDCCSMVRGKVEGFRTLDDGKLSAAGLSEGVRRLAALATEVASREAREGSALTFGWQALIGWGASYVASSSSADSPFNETSSEWSQTRSERSEEEGLDAGRLVTSFLPHYASTLSLSTPLLWTSVKCIFASMEVIEKTRRQTRGGAASGCTDSTLAEAGFGEWKILAEAVGDAASEEREEMPPSEEWLRDELSLLSSVASQADSDGDLSLLAASTVQFVLNSRDSEDAAKRAAALRGLVRRRGGAQSACEESLGSCYLEKAGVCADILNTLASPLVLTVTQSCRSVLEVLDASFVSSVEVCASEAVEDLRSSLAALYKETCAAVLAPERLIVLSPLVKQERKRSCSQVYADFHRRCGLAKTRAERVCLMTCLQKRHVKGASCFGFDELSPRFLDEFFKRLLALFADLSKSLNAVFGGEGPSPQAAASLRRRCQVLRRLLYSWSSLIKTLCRCLCLAASPDESACSAGESLQRRLECASASEQSAILLQELLSLLEGEVALRLNAAYFDLRRYAQLGQTEREAAVESNSHLILEGLLKSPSLTEAFVKVVGNAALHEESVRSGRRADWGDCVFDQQQPLHRASAEEGLRLLCESEVSSSAHARPNPQVDLPARSSDAAVGVSGWILRELILGRAMDTRQTSLAALAAAGVAAFASSQGCVVSAAAFRSALEVARRASVDPSSFPFRLSLPTIRRSQQLLRLSGDSAVVPSRAFLANFVANAAGMHALVSSSRLLRLEGKGDAALEVERRLADALFPLQDAAASEEAREASCEKARLDAAASAVLAAAEAEGITAQQRAVSAGRDFSTLWMAHLLAELETITAEALCLQQGAWLLVDSKSIGGGAEGGVNGRSPDAWQGRAQKCLVEVQNGIDAVVDSQMRQLKASLPFFLRPFGAASGLACAETAAAVHDAHLPFAPALLACAGSAVAAGWKLSALQRRLEKLLCRSESAESEAEAAAGERLVVESHEARRSLGLELLAAVWLTQLDAHHSWKAREASCSSHLQSAALLSSSSPAPLHRGFISRRHLSQLATGLAGLRGFGEAVVESAAFSHGISGGSSKTLDGLFHADICTSLSGAHCCAFVCTVLSQLRFQTSIASAATAFLFLSRMQTQLRRASQALRLSLPATKTEDASCTADAPLVRERGRGVDASQWAALSAFFGLLLDTCWEGKADGACKAADLLRHCGRLWLGGADRKTLHVAFSETVDELQGLSVSALGSRKETHAGDSEGEGRVRLAAGMCCLLVQLLFEDSLQTQESGKNDCLTGISGAFWRGVIWLLLGRWAVFAASREASRELRRRRSQACWGAALRQDVGLKAVELKALQLRAAAVDGCDAPSCLYTPLATTSAAASLANAAAEDLAALACLHSEVVPESRGESLLPLVAEAVPAVLAVRLLGETAKTEGSAASTEKAQRLVAAAIADSARVDASSTQVLAEWLQEVEGFATEFFSADALSAALPVVRHLFEDCRLCKAAAPSVSAETLRATASAAVFSASRLSAAFPLVGRVNATAFLGLLAAGKGIHEVLAAAPLLATLFPESASTQRVGDSQPLCAFPLSPVRIQGPSDAENPETALEEETAPLMLRAQTLLRWLTAASEVGTPSADGGLRTTRLVNAARRELLPLLQEVARRQLEWRDKKRAAEDATKTLLERLEDLVEDRAAEESARKKGRSASALEKERNEEVAALFPSEEWGEASEDFSKSQEETSGPVPTSQYDAWLSGSTANDGNDAESESLSEVESNMGEATFAGFSEEDLSAFWNSVLRAFTSRQDRLSETAETSVECYRDAFSAAFCLLLSSTKSQEPQRPLVLSVGKKKEGLFLFDFLDDACGPHLAALLMKAVFRCVNASPLDDAREEARLQQLLLDDDSAEEPAALPSGPGDSPPKSVDAQSEQAESATATATTEEDEAALLIRERLQLQRERARKLRFSKLCSSLGARTGGRLSSRRGGACSFYAEGNPALLQSLAPSVAALQSAASAIAVALGDHPALNGLLLRCQRLRAMSLFETSPADALSALEGLLDSAASLRSSVDSGHLRQLLAQTAGDASLSAEPQRQREAASALLSRFDKEVAGVERKVLLMRKRQLAEWRFLREFRELRLREKSVQLCPFLWTVADDDRAASSSTEAGVGNGTKSDAVEERQASELPGFEFKRLVDAAPTRVLESLLQFLKSAPLGEFDGRLRSMDVASSARRALARERHKAASSSCGFDAPGESDAVAVLEGSLARFAFSVGWSLCVNERLGASRNALDREVSSLASLARWDLTNRRQMKQTVQRTHVQLAKLIRSFDESLAEPALSALHSFESARQSALVSAMLSLPPRSQLSPTGASGDEDVALRVASVWKCLKELARTLRLEGQEGAALDCAEVLRGLHAFDARSCSASSLALEVAEFCRDFLSTLEAAERQNEARVSETEAGREDGPSAREARTQKVSRQQLQRMLGDFRALLRDTLQLPQLGALVGAQTKELRALLAASLNDSSGLSSFEDETFRHPLSAFAELEASDVGPALREVRQRRVQISCALTRKEKEVQTTLDSRDDSGGPAIFESLGEVWRLSSTLWHLSLQTFSSIGENREPHRDVAGDRRQLLGFLVGLLLQHLRRRQHCWSAVPAFQRVVDALAVLLSSGSVSVPTADLADLAAATEVVEEAVLQTRSLLPSEVESKAQRDALRFFAADASEGKTCGESEWNSLLEDEALQRAAALRSVLEASLENARVLRRCFQDAAEGRLLETASDAHGRVAGVNSEEKATQRIRLSWLSDVADASRKVQSSIFRSDAQTLFNSVLPPAAVAGLTRSVKTLQAKLASVEQHAEAQRKIAPSNGRGEAQLVAAFEEIADTLQKVSQCTENASPSDGFDEFLQVRENSAGEELRPHFNPNTLPPASLEELFSFKAVAAAVGAISAKAPPFVDGERFWKEETLAEKRTLLSKVVLRGAGILLAAFDGLEASSRVTLSVAQLVGTLLQKGLVLRNSEEEEAAKADAQRSSKEKVEWTSGTGLGEGEGARDAAEPVEDEWQFDGLENEQQTEEPRKKSQGPKTDEEDKALEVSMEFDAEAQAAPPQSQGEDGAGEKKKEDEAMDCEEGLVDLSEGGTIENKAKPDSAGDDDDSPEDENAAEQQGQREDIQVEGEKLRGEKELEAASEEADGERQSTPEDETQKHSKDAEAPEAQTEEGPAEKFHVKVQGGDGEEDSEAESLQDEDDAGSEGVRDEDAKGEAAPDADWNREDVFDDAELDADSGGEGEGEGDDDAESNKRAVLEVDDAFKEEDSEDAERESQDGDAQAVEEGTEPEAEKDAADSEEREDNTNAAADSEDSNSPKTDDEEPAETDPTTQGLEPSRREEALSDEDGGSASEDNTSRAERPKPREREAAFGVEGSDSAVRRDPGEAEESQAGAAEEGVGEADSSEARVSDEGGALGSSSSSDSPQQSQRRQGERPSLPSNPLEDESAAERWLEKVRLIERSEKNSAKSEEEASGEAAENAADDEARKEDAAAKEEMEDEIEESGLYERDETSARQALAEVDSSAPQEDGQRPRRRNEDGDNDEAPASEDASSEEEDEAKSSPRADRLRDAKAASSVDVKEQRQQPSEAAAASENDDSAAESEEDLQTRSQRLFDALSVNAEQRDPHPIADENLLRNAGTASEEKLHGEAPLTEDEKRAMTNIDEMALASALEGLGRREALTAEHASELWRLLELKTAGAAASLSESLRLVLEPTVASAWEGGHRQGKKLSMRRVLAFVASSFRDDRIWLRRRRPQGFNYRVFVAVDCSKSMQAMNAAAGALEAVVLLSQAFNNLQIGSVSVAVFGGAKPEVCIHPTTHVGVSEGEQLLQKCTFQEETHQSHDVAVADVLKLAIQEMEGEAAATPATGGDGRASSTLILILSDGRFNKELTRPWVKAAIARRCVPVLLILDPAAQQSSSVSSKDGARQSSPAEASPSSTSKPPVSSSSIFDLKQVHQQPGGEISVKPYLHDFPFPYYTVVGDSSQLSPALADVIRQWVEATASAW